MKQMALDMGLAPEASFANLWVGRNEACVKHLSLWANSVTRSPVPTYLWGDAGCGKTHLLKAAANALRDLGQTVGWLDKTVAEPSEFDPNWSAVMLDDVHQFDAVQQRAAFKWFVDAQTHQRWVLAAGAKPVADLVLREDVRTRLGWGHVFELAVLTEAERRAVLRQQADARGVFLKDDVMDFVLARFSRDLGSLMQLLDELDKYALAKKRPITVPLIKKMLQEL
jgi:DnaA-homolog protein